MNKYLELGKYLDPLIKTEIVKNLDELVGAKI